MEFVAAEKFSYNVCISFQVPNSISRMNIGFSPNGEGENKILDPEGKNSCPSGEAAWARILA